MRPLILLLLASAAFAQAPIVSMKALMLDVIYPFSNSIFYIEREAPQNEVEWLALEAKTLALAEVTNLMMTKERRRDDDVWMADAKLLLDAATIAYKATKARDIQPMIALNDALYEACQSCHVHYRPGYRRKP